jgi:hypothetical protein
VSQIPTIPTPVSQLDERDFNNAVAGVAVADYFEDRMKIERGDMWSYVNEEIDKIEIPEPTVIPPNLLTFDNNN